jgi:ketol-acid reductoisomerase
MKLIIDLVVAGGLKMMNYSISDTAEYGGYQTGKRLITKATRDEMKKVLAEIKDGTFANAWIRENEAGRPEFQKMRAEQQAHPVEKTGAALRAKMNFPKEDYSE